MDKLNSENIKVKRRRSEWGSLSDDLKKDSSENGTENKKESSEYDWSPLSEQGV